jgi:DNA-binding transcriptional ArsR family regulator
MPRQERCPRRALVWVERALAGGARWTVGRKGLTALMGRYNLSVMEPMGYAEAAQLDATFAALADPTRRAILARLAAGEASVSELAAPFAMSQPAISKHLKVLERAGLVSPGRDAQRRPRRLVAQPLAGANEWLEGYRRFWEQSYERLDALLDEMKAAGTKATAGKRPARNRRGRR